MPHDNSLGDQNTFDGGENQFDPKSIGDEKTFIGNKLDSFDEADDSSFGEREDLSKRYTIEGTLGKGGMGVVLLATDTRLGRKVALKRILGKAARSKKAIDRFITEAKSVAAVKHINIVDIYDFGLATDGPYLTMEYVEGSSLEERCRQGPLEVEEAVSICCQLCDGLARAHSANIIHRDIKPANVLMTTDGVPKLTDFGLAKDDAADTGMTMAGTVLGTLDFMPPEQRKDAALVDSRSDLWSLAATLYQMVAGEPPRVIDLDLVPKLLRTSLAQALKSKKEERYQTVIDFRDALLSATGTLPIETIANGKLATGQCAECNAMNNEKRKFCSQCAAPLRIDCLKCNQDIPVWDRICGNCGGIQTDLLADRRKWLSEQIDIATRAKSDMDYRLAVQTASPISLLKDARFTEQVDWAARFLGDLEIEQQNATSKVSSLITAAKQYLDSHDYDLASESLNEIPTPLVDSEIRSLRSLIESTLLRGDELLKEVKELRERKTLNKLPAKILEYRSLFGNSRDKILKDAIGHFECPNCGVTADLSVRCCAHCSEEYYTECISCDKQLIIWSEVCEYCQGNQSLLGKRRLEEWENELQKADDLFDEGRFAEARKMSKKVRDALTNFGNREREKSTKLRLRQKQLTDSINASEHAYEELLVIIQDQLKQNDPSRVVDLIYSETTKNQVFIGDLKRYADERILEWKCLILDKAKKTIENGDYLGALEAIGKIPPDFRDSRWNNVASEAKGYFQTQLKEKRKVNPNLFFLDIERFLSVYPDDIDILEYKAEAFYKDESWNDSAKIYDRLCQLDPSRERFALQRSSAARRLGMLDEAIEVLKNLLERPDLSKKYQQNALYNIGCYYSLASQIPNAIRYLELAFEAGYRKAHQYWNDPDLENLKEIPEFQAILNRKEMELTYACFNCKTSLTSKIDCEGSTATCPRCNSRLTVPTVRTSVSRGFLRGFFKR